MRQSNPTGKSLRICGINVKPRGKKYFAFPEGQISAYIWPSRPTQRASAVVTDVGRVAMDADVATDERDRGVRQRRVVLTSRCWRQRTWRQLLSGRNGGKRAVLRGELVISRKAIAQGMSDVLRCPVCSCAAFLAQFAHEIAGAARIRHSLRPLFEEGEEFLAKLGRNASRECGTISMSSRP